MKELHDMVDQAWADFYMLLNYVKNRNDNYSKAGLND